MGSRAEVCVCMCCVLKHLQSLALESMKSLLRNGMLTSPLLLSLFDQVCVVYVGYSACCAEQSRFVSEHGTALVDFVQMAFLQFGFPLLLCMCVMMMQPRILFRY